MDRTLILVVVSDVPDHTVIVIMPLGIYINALGPLVGNRGVKRGFRQVGCYPSLRVSAEKGPCCLEFLSDEHEQGYNPNENQRR